MSPLVRAGLLQGQADLEAGSSWRAFDCEKAAVHADDSQCGVESQAQPMPRSLGGEEWLEDAALLFFRNPRTIVLDFDKHQVGGTPDPEPDVPAVGSEDSGDEPEGHRFAGPRSSQDTQRSVAGLKARTQAEAVDLLLDVHFQRGCARGFFGCFRIPCDRRN